MHHIYPVQYHTNRHSVSTLFNGKCKW